jgi:hypothetical protein
MNARRVSGTVRVALLSGLAIMAAAAPAATSYDELLNIAGYEWDGRGDVFNELGIVVKQSLELFGWGLVAAAMCLALGSEVRRSGFRLPTASGISALRRGVRRDALIAGYRRGSADDPNAILGHMHIDQPPRPSVHREAL